MATDAGQPSRGIGLAGRPDSRPRLHAGSRGRALHDRGGHPGSRRRGRARARGRRPARLPGPGRLAAARGHRARLPGRPGRAAGPARPGAVCYGLDLGPTTHQEIAVAILAELVQLRASGALAGTASYERQARHRIRAAGWAGGARPAARPALVTDPVCGMTVSPRTRPARCGTRAPTTTSAVQLPPGVRAGP